MLHSQTSHLPTLLNPCSQWRAHTNGGHSAENILIFLHFLKFDKCQQNIWMFISQNNYFNFTCNACRRFVAFANLASIDNFESVLAEHLTNRRTHWRTWHLIVTIGTQPLITITITNTTEFLTNFHPGTHTFGSCWWHFITFTNTAIAFRLESVLAEQMALEFGTH